MFYIHNIIHVDINGYYINIIPHLFYNRQIVKYKRYCLIGECKEIMKNIIFLILYNRYLVLRVRARATSVYLPRPWKSHLFNRFGYVIGCSVNGYQFRRCRSDEFQRIFRIPKSRWLNYYLIRNHYLLF